MTIYFAPFSRAAVLQLLPFSVENCGFRCRSFWITLKAGLVAFTNLVAPTFEGLAVGLGSPTACPSVSYSLVFGTKAKSTFYNADFKCCKV